MEKITIVGGGNGGFSAAADLTIKGHQITLYDCPEFADNLKEVMELGGIEMEAYEGNGLTGGFARLHKITTDIEEAIGESDIIMVVVPTYAMERMATLCAPYLRDGQIVALNPGNFFGPLYFREIMVRLGYGDTKITYADFSCMNYAARKKSPSKIWVRGYKHDLGVAMFPQKGSEEAFARLQGIFPEIIQYTNIIETGLSNMNTTLHTSLMLLNAANIDNQEDRLFYRECMTKSLDNIMSKLDAERLSFNQFGMKVRPLAQIMLDWYAHQGGTGTTPVEIQHSLPHFGYSKMPTSMDFRYVSEDVPFGLIPSAALLDLMGLDHTVHTSLANVLCAITDRDYYKEARTMADFGIEGMTAQQILDYLYSGEKA